MSRFRVIPPAETRLTRQQMYDIVRTPVITEKATAVSENNQVIFRVALEATPREQDSILRKAVPTDADGGDEQCAGRYRTRICGRAIGLSDLTRCVALGARDVGLRVLVLERLFQGPDHPVPAAFPDGLYLSTVIVQIIRD